MASSKSETHHMEDDKLPPAGEATVSASTRRLMIYLVLLHVFAFGGFWAFMEWTTSHYQAQRRFIPFWQFPDNTIQQQWRDVRMDAISSIELENGQWLHVTASKTAGGATNPSQVSVKFPSQFYSGVLYGVSASHPQGMEAHEDVNAAANVELYKELKEMWPQPKAIYRRVSATFPSSSSSSASTATWIESGWVVYFDKPSAEAERGILFLARSFGQSSVYKWWGHVWSYHPTDDVTIMQGVVPVASGLSHMRYELPAYITTTPPSTQHLPHTSHPTQHINIADEL